MGLDLATLQETVRRAQAKNGGLTALGMRFYERLFEKYPAVRPLFNTPPEQQHKKLMASIGAIVAGASNLEQLVPYLQAMGIRHVRYGTRPEHYPAVAENLLAVLEEHLSAEGEWTPQMRAAWSQALEVVAQVMVDAANNPEAAEASLSAAGYQPDGFRADTQTPWVTSTLANAS